MKRRLFIKIIGIFLLVAIAFIGWKQWSRYQLRAAIEETRQQLRTKGFRSELADFDLRPADELRGRADTLAKAAATLRGNLTFQELQLMEAVGTQTARRATSIPFIITRGVPSASAQLTLFFRAYSEAQTTSDNQSSEPVAKISVTNNLWDVIAVELQSSGGDLDRAAQTIAKGDFRFEVVLRSVGSQSTFPGDINRFAAALKARTALAIRHNYFDEAFTGMLALTHLTTHWRTEPVAYSYQAKFFCIEVAFRSLWEALQTDSLSDEQLALLQRLWEQAALFDGLPETVALEGAGMVQSCRDYRKARFMGGVGGWRQAYRQTVNSFGDSATNGLRTLTQFISAYRQFASYQSTGSYEDEKNLMPYYHEREMDLRRALACATWEQMRRIPGATNLVKFQTSRDSPMHSLINLQMLSPSRADDESLLMLAAESEARRRLMVTAIAIKRFQLQHGRNPKALSELVPHLLASLPLDFMDGKELRYERFEDGRYILYSIGLDCVDDGGRMKTARELREQSKPLISFAQLPTATFAITVRSGIPTGTSWLHTDILWPMPANNDEIADYEKSKAKALSHLDDILLQPIEIQRFLKGELK